MVLFNLMPFLSHIKTNEFIIFLVFIIFVIIVVIILRYVSNHFFDKLINCLLFVSIRRMDVLNESSTVRLNREQMSAQSMVRLKNPFMFKIKEESLNCNNYRNGLKLTIKCDNSFWVFAYWAVNIEELHYNLDDEWQTMRVSLIDHKFIENQYLFRSEPELYETSKSNIF